LEQLHQKQNYEGENIENLKIQIQELKEENRLAYESYRRELLGVSNAFGRLALQRTLEAWNLTSNKKENIQTLNHNNINVHTNNQGRTATDSFEISNTMATCNGQYNKKSHQNNENVDDFFKKVSNWPNAVHDTIKTQRKTMSTTKKTFLTPKAFIPE